MDTKITSQTKEVIIGDTYPTVIIGERINPTGKKSLQEALKNKDFEIISREAINQVKYGADILDVNVGMPDINEVMLLPEAVRVVMDVVDVPLCIDSSNPDALASALKVYNGKALVNSVTGEENSLARVLPLVKEYGTAVIGLTQDDKGIPRDTERRIEIAKKIINRALSMHITLEDIIIDLGTLSVGIDASAGRKVLDAIKLVKTELGVNTVLAASNISFGMPDRPILNNAYSAIVISAGVNCLIADAQKIRPAILAADLIIGKDYMSRRYIEDYRRRLKEQQ